jgi:hypothetical protein
VRGGEVANDNDKGVEERGRGGGGARENGVLTSSVVGGNREIENASTLPLQKMLSDPRVYCASDNFRKKATSTHL